MKIGIITSTLSFGGVNRVAIEEAKLLSKYGHEVTLVSLIEPSYYINIHEELLDGVNYKFLIRGKYIKYSKARDLFQRCFYLLKNFDENYDLIIAHNLPAARVSYKMWRKMGIPYICYQHDPGNYTFVDPLYFVFSLNKKIFKKFEIIYLKRSKQILVNSNRSSQSLKLDTGLESKIVYPSSSLVGTLSENEIPKDRADFFLTVHRIGFDPLFTNLISILEKIEDLKLIIAGSTVSGRTDKVIEMFNHLKTRVQFVFNPSDDELKNLYLTARGLLHPSIENFNLVALEAASYGCPVISFKESGVFEIFRGKCEYGFVNDGELDNFCELIKKLSYDKGTAQTLGNTQYYIANDFTNDRHVKELIGIIENIR